MQSKDSTPNNLQSYNLPVILDYESYVDEY